MSDCDTPPRGPGPLDAGVSAPTSREYSERRRLLDALALLEEENRRLSDDLANAQEQVVELAERFVALSRLHAAPDQASALKVVEELVVNLVGSEELVVLGRGAGGLEPLLASGVDAERVRRLVAAPGSAGCAAETGILHLPRDPPLPGDEGLTAAVPLRVAGRPAGVLAIFGLLGQKAGLSPSDHAVFDLLAEHAGAALRLASAPAGGARTAR
jgi:hypothetical protein